LIFLALFVACFLAWKAVERLRNRGKSDAVAQEDGDPETHQMPWNQADYRRSQYFRGEWTEFGGMSEREQEEFSSAYAPHKERKAVKERRKAREQAQKRRRDFEH
jgi:flagellar biosynthesis/type III secretory pathway M-ring protein FliF/YscJ